MAYLSPSNLTTIKLTDGWTALIVAGAPASETQTGASAPDTQAGAACSGTQVGTESSGTWDECSGRPNPSHDWVPLLRDLIKDRSAVPGYSVLKYGADGEVGRARTGSGAESTEIICKQSKARGIVKTLATIFVGSRARRNCERAFALLEANILTPQPLALMHSRWPHSEAWLITRFVPDLVDLDHVASSLIPRLDAAARGRVKRRIIVALVELLHRLEHGGLVHRDLKASNILLRHWNEDGGPVEIYLADLDGLRRAGPRRGENGKQTLVRLAASLLHHPAITLTDRARFLRSWMTAMSLRVGDRKLLFRDLARRAERYARRSRHRKSHKLDGYSGD